MFKQKMFSAVGSSVVLLVVAVVLSLALSSCEPQEIESPKVLSFEDFKAYQEEQKRALYEIVGQVERDLEQGKIKREEELAHRVEVYTNDFVDKSTVFNLPPSAVSQIISQVPNFSSDDLAEPSRGIKFYELDNSNYSSDQQKFLNEISELLSDTTISSDVLQEKLALINERVGLEVGSDEDKYVIWSVTSSIIASISWFEEKINSDNSLVSGGRSVRPYGWFRRTASCIRRSWSWRDFGGAVLSGAVGGVFSRFRNPFKKIETRGLIGAIGLGAVAGGSVYAVGVAYNCGTGGGEGRNRI